MQSRRFIARYLCTHFAEQGDQVGHFRLARGIFQDRLALGESSSHQNIFSAGYRDFFEYDVSPF